MPDTADCFPDYFTIGISSRHDDLNVDEHENLQVYTVGDVKKIGSRSLKAPCIIFIINEGAFRSAGQEQIFVLIGLVSDILICCSKQRYLMACHH